MVVYSMYGTARLFHTDRLIWGLLPVILLPMANTIYSGTLIATIAVVIAVAFEIIFNKKYRFAAVAALIVVVYLVLGSLTRAQFYKDAGIPTDAKGVPSIAWVYMGITSDTAVAGTGSWNADNENLYVEYGDKASDIALQGTIDALKEYASGERDLDFFWEKTVFQWLDPYFSSLTMTCNPEAFEYMSEEFISFLFGGVPYGVFNNMLRFYIAFAYMFAFIGAMSLLKGREFSNSDLMATLLFIGGVVFYLFWEQKSRYSLTYFICLLPMTAKGVLATAKALGYKALNLKKKYAIGILVVQAALIVLVYLIKAGSEAAAADVAEFYSDVTEEPLIYSDNSFDETQRAIHSDMIRLDKGVYDIDAYYESDFPMDLKYGAKTYLKARGGETVYYEQAKYSYIDENGHTHFRVFVPKSGTRVQIEVFIDNIDRVILPSDKTGYFLMDHFHVANNPKESAVYALLRVLTIFVLADFLVWLFMAYPKKENI
jgi:hypothetical protein